MLVSGRVYPTKPPSLCELPGAYSVSVRRLEGPSGDAMELGKTLRLASCRAMMEGWKIGGQVDRGMELLVFGPKNGKCMKCTTKRHIKMCESDIFFEDGVFNDVHVGSTIKTNLSGLSIRYIRWWFSLTPD